MSNYDIVTFNIDYDMAKTLYYKGVAITLQSWFLEHNPLTIHYDLRTNINFTIMLKRYAEANDIRTDMVNIMIEAKGGE